MPRPGRCSRRRANCARTARVTCEASVFDGGLENTRQCGPDETDGGGAQVLLESLLPTPQHFGTDAIERQGTEVRDDVPADPLLDALEGGRVATLGGPPVGRDVVLEGDGSIAWIDELAPTCVGLSLGEPGLGVLEYVEGTVLDAGDALDTVAGALAVHGRAFTLAGRRVGALLEPPVFYVAGQVELLDVEDGYGVLRRLERQALVRRVGRS